MRPRSSADDDEKLLSCPCRSDGGADVPRSRARATARLRRSVTPSSALRDWRNMSMLVLHNSANVPLNSTNDKHRLGETPAIGAGKEDGIEGISSRGVAPVSSDDVVVRIVGDKYTLGAIT